MWLLPSEGPPWLELSPGCHRLPASADPGRTQQLLALIRGLLREPLEVAMVPLAALRHAEMMHARERGALLVACPEQTRPPPECQTAGARYVFWTGQAGTEGLGWLERDVKPIVYNRLVRAFQRVEHPLAGFDIASFPLAEAAKRTGDPLELVELVETAIQVGLERLGDGMSASRWLESLDRATGRTLAARLSGLSAEAQGLALEALLDPAAGVEASAALTRAGLSAGSGARIRLGPLARCVDRPAVLVSLVERIPLHGWTARGRELVGARQAPRLEPIEMMASMGLAQAPPSPRPPYLALALRRWIPVDEGPTAFREALEALLDLDGPMTRAEARKASVPQLRRGLAVYKDSPIVAQRNQAMALDAALDLCAAHGPEDLDSAAGALSRLLSLLDDGAVARRIEQTARLNHAMLLRSLYRSLADLDEVALIASGALEREDLELDLTFEFRSLQASLKLAQGEQARALELLREEVLPLAEALNSDAALLNVQIDIAEAALAVGELGTAEQALDVASQHLSPDVDTPESRVALVRMRARLARALNRLTLAESLLREQLVMIESTPGMRHAQLNTVILLSEMLLEQNRPRDAQQMLEEMARPLMDTIGTASEQAWFHGVLAHAHAQLGDHQQAQDLYMLAADRYAGLGRRREAAVMLGHLASEMSMTGRGAEAEEILRQEVLPLLERLGASQDQAQMRLKLASVLLSNDKADAALEIAEQVCTSVTAASDPSTHVWSNHVAMRALFKLKRYAEMMKRVESAAAQLDPTQHAHWIGQNLILAADAARLNQCQSEAIEIVTHRILPIASDRPVLRATALLRLALLTIETAPPEDLIAQLREALSTLGEAPPDSDHVHAHLLLARALHRRAQPADRPEIRRLLKRARELAEALGLDDLARVAKRLRKEIGQ